MTRILDKAMGKANSAGFVGSARCCGSGKGGRLKDDSTADLEATHRAGSGNLAEGTGAAKRGSGIAEVDEVEDVGGFAAELEADALVNAEVAKDGGVHILISGAVERVGANQAIESGGATAGCAAGSCDAAVGAGVKPLGHFRLTGAMGSEQAFGFAGDEVRTVIVIAVDVVIVATGDAERLAAVHGKRRGDGPSVESVLCEAVGVFKVIRLPHAGDYGLVAHVVRLALTLKVQGAVILGLGGGAVADVSGGLHVGAGESLAPDVEAMKAEAVAETLGDGKLQAVVVGSLPVFDDVAVAHVFRAGLGVGALGF